MTTQDISRLAADTIRFLSAEAVQKANSGHPGAPMGLADAAVALYTNFMSHNPADPTWANRDRFILSGGHGSMLLYSLLHLTGYDLSMEEIKNFRQWGSLTPGHPESHLTPGVETTTGPLGQGISNATGFAMAEAWLASRFNQPDFNIVDHYTYVMCGDGDLQEGVSHEASALAGHLGLGKLIVIYDDNGIQIDGSTDLAFTEDVLKRYEAYGWEVSRVAEGNDVTAVQEAIAAAKKVTDKPSLIAIKTVIGFGSPNKGGTKSAHGSPLGDDEIALVKKELGWEVADKFHVPADVYSYMSALEAGAAAQEEWNTLFANYANAHPDLAADFVDQMNGRLPAGWTDSLPVFGPDDKMATRAASGKVLASLVPAIPALLGGSADLTGSNKTIVNGTGYLKPGDIDGRYVYYGVREHGMAATMNGLALHGGVIPYGGTFFVFTDYMRGGMRLSSLMDQQVIYVLTHDSIGLGEDGPTHQPIEHMMAMRAMPNMYVIRPADPNETAMAWQIALERKHGPTSIVLTRQGLPVIPADTAQGALKGAYALGASDDDTAAILASGSEVEIAVAAQAELAAKGIKARVISMPCWELFDEQSDEYKESILPASITNRVSIEAGVTLGWQKHIGSGTAIGLDHFGASAPYQTLYQEFGLTAENVVAAVESGQ